eukprot:3639036-Pleurochrysis_carterae.AAC.1
MDFQQRYSDHKNLSFLSDILGGITDQELLSFILQGSRWKVTHAPRQIRIANNLSSLDARTRQVADSTIALVDKG